MKTNFKSRGYEIDLDLRSHITVINGDSATGKSFFYYLMSRVKDRDDIICINYESTRPKANYDALVKTVEASTNKLIIIDQADDIQREDDSLMYVINTDQRNNTFIVIGRSPRLLYNISDMAEIKINNNQIKLEYSFPEPLF